MPRFLVGVQRGSIISQNRGIAKDIKKFYLLLLHQLCDIKIIITVIALAQKSHNKLPCTVRTFRQRSYNQRVICLQWLGSVAISRGKWFGPQVCYKLSPEVWWVMLETKELVFTLLKIVYRLFWGVFPPRSKKWFDMVNLFSHLCARPPN